MKTMCGVQLNDRKDKGCSTGDGFQQNNQSAKYGKRCNLVWLNVEVGGQLCLEKGIRIRG